MYFFYKAQSALSTAFILDGLSCAYSTLLNWRHVVLADTRRTFLEIQAALEDMLSFQQKTHA